MGHKIWTVGEEVVAADFQSYLQDQTVPQFPNVAARDTWAAPPTGALSVTTDTLTVWQRTASEWVAFGVARSQHATVLGAGGTQGNTTYENLTVSLGMSFAKANASTVLTVGITGHVFIDDALASCQVGLKVNALADVEVDSISTLAAGAAHTVAGTVRVAAGLVGATTLTARWKVGASGAVATQVGRWSMLVTETT